MAFKGSTSIDGTVFGQPDMLAYPEGHEATKTNVASGESKEQGLRLEDVLASIEAENQADSTPNQPDGERTGTLSSIKRLFEGPAVCHCCINWVEEYPDDVKECFENTLEAKEHALVVRVRKNHTDQNPTTIDSIVIQSPMLKSVLQEIIGEYPGITPLLDHLVFEAPFECLFHRWSALETALESERNGKIHQHLSLLHSVLAEEFKSTLPRYRDLTSHGVIRFQDLWTIFMPDDIILLSVNSKQSDEAGQLSSARYAKKIVGDDEFVIRCRQVAWDGYRIGYCDQEITIAKFPGTKNILDLDAYPLKHHKSPNDVREKLIARGRRFESLAHVKPMDYKGLALVGAVKRNLLDVEQTSAFMVGPRIGLRLNLSLLINVSIRRMAELFSMQNFITRIIAKKPTADLCSRRIS